MAQFLAQNHLLTLFLVVGLGAILGAIRVGPFRFGAAGALFVGLLVSAYSPEAGHGTAIIQQIGLAFFVYTVGIAAGSTFFADLRRQSSLLGSATIICVVGAIIAWAGGHFLGRKRHPLTRGRGIRRGNRPRRKGCGNSQDPRLARRARPHVLPAA